MALKCDDLVHQLSPNEHPPTNPQTLACGERETLQRAEMPGRLGTRWHNPSGMNPGGEAEGLPTCPTFPASQPGA